MKKDPGLRVLVPVFFDFGIGLQPAETQGKLDLRTRYPQILTFSHLIFFLKYSLYKVYNISKTVPQNKSTSASSASSVTSLFWNKKSGIALLFRNSGVKGFELRKDFIIKSKKVKVKKLRKDLL